MTPWLESENLIVRHLEEADKEFYFNIHCSRWKYLELYTEHIFEKEWEGQFSEKIISCVVIEKASGKICGFCELSKAETRTPHIGIDIFDTYKGNGYGQEVATLLIHYGKTELDIDYLIWEVFASNSISRHMAEKNGGELLEKKTLVPKELLDEGIEKGLLTEEDISYIYVYKISVDE